MKEGSSSRNEELLEVAGIRFASRTGVDMASRACKILCAELLRTTLAEDEPVAEAEPLGVEGTEDTEEDRAWIRFLTQGKGIALGWSVALR